MQGVKPSLANVIRTVDSGFDLAKGSELWWLAKYVQFLLLLQMHTWFIV